MEFCIYLRKSRSDADAEAHGEGETLARHEKALLELGKRQKLNITQIYREIVSGETIAARPVMQQLLTEVEQGSWDGVLVMEVERLARGDTVDQGIVAQTFKYSGTKIITPAKTFDPSNEFDEEYFEFGLFMSRREYKTINRRLQRGRVASVMEGKFIGNKTPYGYNRVRVQNGKGFTLEVVPDEAETVRMIYNLFAFGEQQPDGSMRRLGMGSVAKRLNRMHITPKGGGEWADATIRDMLRNPVYIGKIRYNWRPTAKRMSNGKMTTSRKRTDPEDWTVVPGLHEAIIDDITWAKAQQYAYGKSTRDLSEDIQIKNPLAGLAVCGKCGGAMTRRPYNRDYDDTLFCRRRNCDNISTSLKYVEERILTSLAGWLETYKLKWAEEKKKDNLRDATTEFKRKTLKRLDAEAEKLKGQLNNVYDLLEQGVYSTDVFLERSKTLNDRIDEIARERAGVVDDIRNALFRDDSIKNIIPKIEHVLEVYRTLPDAQSKNDALKEVLERVEYIKSVNGRWHNRPDDFEIVLYPKIAVLRDGH